MSTFAPGNQPYEDLKATLKAMGFSVVKENWSFGSMVESSVRRGTKAIARLSFSSGDGYVHLRVLPADPSSHSLMAGGGHTDNQRKLDSLMLEVEALFRTYLVSSGKLAFEEYPSDRMLKHWVEENVLNVDGEYPRFKPASPVAVKAYGLIKRLNAQFDRSTALRLQRVLADLQPVDDRSLLCMSQSAASLSDQAFRRHSAAWTHGSGGAYLLHPATPAPARSPLPEEESVSMGFGR